MPHARTVLVALAAAALVCAAPRADVVQSADLSSAPVYIVRHAERADAGSMTGMPGTAGTTMMSPADPSLSREGALRAGRLAAMLRAAGITRVFTTEYARTRQTAEPLAAVTKVPITVVPSKDMTALIQRLREPGGPALVVGHSNTVPEILKALGATEPIQIGDAEYDNLFIVVRGAGAAQVLKLKY